MPRPCKRRRIRGKPFTFYFKPRGIKLVELDEIVLSLAEFEALRLIDLNGIAQEEAAKLMHVSQPTLSRILNSARKKVADAIVNAKAIKIEQDN